MNKISFFLDYLSVNWRNNNMVEREIFDAEHLAVKLGMMHHKSGKSGRFTFY